MSHLKMALRTAYRKINRRFAIRENVFYHPSLVVGTSGYIIAPSRLEIGQDVSIGRNCWIASNGRIGNGVLISSYVAIVGRYDHDMKQVGVPISRAAWVYESAFREQCFPSDATIVEDDVWVGYGSVILSGVTIGRSAVIAAGSIVTRDVQENSIVAGNPARIVGERFSPGDFSSQTAALTRRYGCKSAIREE